MQILNDLYGYRLMVDRSSSKRCAPIRIRLAVLLVQKQFIRAINLTGKGLSCRESRYRIVAYIARHLLL